MEDVASLLFMFGGVLTYPIFFHLSLKKSLSIVSKGKAANGRILLSLVILYLETVALVMLSTPLSLIPLPYLGSIITLSAIVLLASYTLKAMFGLSFRRGILAFGLWQALCLALGATLTATILAAASETILTFPLITALILLAWWMWRGRQSVVAGEGDTGVANGTHVGFGDSGKKIAALVMVALLTSTLLAPSTIRYVACEPQEVKGEEVEVEGDFSWVNETIRAYIAWVNATLEEGNITQVDSTTVAKLAVTWLWEFSNGFSEETGEYAVGLVNLPGALKSLHDAERDLAYLSLLSNVTSIQDILKDSQPSLQRNPTYKSTDGDSKGPPSSYARDAALADELSSLSKKDFKVSVAENPDSISKAFDIERYVESVAWGRAAFDLLASSLPLAGETYRWIESTTGDKQEASYGWLRTFGLSAPLVENAEAFKSGDPGRIGRSVAQTALSYTLLYVMIKAAVEVAKAKGVAVGVAKAAYDYIVPAQGLYAILKGGLSGIKGALSDIGDANLRTYLEGKWADLKATLTGYEYIPFLSSDEDLLISVAPTDILYGSQELLQQYADGKLEGRVEYDTYQEFFFKMGLKGLKIEGLNQIISEDWIYLIEKVSDKEWVRSVFKEFCDYGKLGMIEQGEMNVRGLKIKVEGSGSWNNKLYYSVRLVDVGEKLRVYEDNTISFRYNNDWYGLDLNNPKLKVVNTELTTILTKGGIDESGFFKAFEKGKGVELFSAKGIVTESGEATRGQYSIIEFTQEDGTTRHVKVTWDGLTIEEFGKRVIGIEVGEDGSVKLLYDSGSGLRKTLIKSPSLTLVSPQVGLFERWIRSDLATDAIWEQIQENSEFNHIQRVIKNYKEFAEQLAYAVSHEKQFITIYGQDTYDALTKIANDILKSETETGCENIGLKGAKVKIEGGVKPHKTGPDAIVWKDGKKLFKVEFKTTGGDCYGRLTDIRAVFKEGEVHLGLILGTNGVEIYENKPLVDIALGRVSQSKLDQFFGALIIPGLYLVSGFLTGTNDKAVSVTDDAGRWIGEFQDSYLDHTVVDRSTVLDSKLTLTSVDGSYLQNVRSTGTTIAGSTVTNCNVSAKLIYDSIVQNTLAVCSTIANSVIDLCRILNSTLVNVIDLDRSHIEDTTITNSADISNCTMIDSNLMSVINLVNASITGSNLTLVANVDNTNVTHSDISYSANISRSEIANTMLRGCTVQGSRLTSCTATDSILRIVNATSSKLTKATVENSNLKGVELRNTSVFGTDLANMALVDRTVMYGRSVYAGETGALRNLTASKVGTPIYSGKGTSSGASKASSVKRSSSTSSPSKTQAVASDETGALRSLLVKSTSSTSSVVQTSSQQVQRAIETAPSGVMPAEARRLLR